MRLNIRVSSQSLRSSTRITEGREEGKRGMSMESRPIWLTAKAWRDFSRKNIISWAQALKWGRVNIPLVGKTGSVLKFTGNPPLEASIKLSNPLACLKYSLACSIWPDFLAFKAAALNSACRLTNSANCFSCKLICFLGTADAVWTAEFGEWPVWEIENYFERTNDNAVQNWQFLDWIFFDDLSHCQFCINEWVGDKFYNFNLRLLSARVSWVRSGVGVAGSGHMMTCGIHQQCALC